MNMDMDFAMSLALWVSAGAAAVSLLVAIGRAMVARLKGTAGDRGYPDKDVTQGLRGADTMVDTMVDAMADDKSAATEDARVGGLGAGETVAAAVEGDVEPNVGKEVAAALGTGDVVPAILSGAVESEFDGAKSESYKEAGQRHVHRWDIVFNRGEWNWELLNLALECYVNAIRYNPDDRHAWVNLAFVYHLIGGGKEARECLAKSNSLSGTSLYASDRSYQQVERAINGNTTLFGERLDRPPMPAGFRDEYEKFLVQLRSSFDTPKCDMVSRVPVAA